MKDLQTKSKLVPFVNVVRYWHRLLDSFQQLNNEFQNSQSEKLKQLQHDMITEFKFENHKNKCTNKKIIYKI